MNILNKTISCDPDTWCRSLYPVMYKILAQLCVYLIFKNKKFTCYSSECGVNNDDQKNSLVFKTEQHYLTLTFWFPFHITLKYNVPQYGIWYRNNKSHAIKKKIWFLIRMWIIRFIILQKVHQPPYQNCISSLNISIRTIPYALRIRNYQMKWRGDDGLS